MTFLLDHDVPDRVGGVLEKLGHEVLRVREVLSPTATDADIFETACRDDLVVITCNRDDFLQLASATVHPGLIVLIRRRSRIAECSALVRLLSSAGPQAIRGNINFA